MKQYDNSDVAVLIDIIESMVENLNYRKENGEITNAFFLDVIDPIHKRCHDNDINAALDKILSDLN